MVDGFGHFAEHRERPLYSAELDRQIPDCREHPQSALKSRPQGKLGWQLAIFDDDPMFQTACPKADNRTGHLSQKAGELNSFQLQGVHHGRIEQQVPPRTVE